MKYGNKTLLQRIQNCFPYAPSLITFADDKFGANIYIIVKIEFFKIF